MRMLITKKVIFSCALVIALFGKLAMPASLEELEKKLEVLEAHTIQLRKDIEVLKKSSGGAEVVASVTQDQKESSEDPRISVNDSNNLYSQGRKGDMVTSLTATIGESPYYRAYPKKQSEDLPEVVKDTVDQGEGSSKNLPQQEEQINGENSSVQAQINQGNHETKIENKLLDASIAKVQSGQFIEGEQELKAYVANPSYPDLGRANYWLGKALYHQKKYNESAQSFIQSYKQAKNTSLGADVLLNLSLSLVQINETDDACKVLSTIGERYPKETIKIGMAQEEKKRLGCP